jgi:hypothetical protein
MNVKLIKVCSANAVPLWGVAGRHMKYDVFDQIVRSTILRQADIRQTLAAPIFQKLIK